MRRLVRPRDAVWLMIGALVGPVVQAVATKALGKVVL